MWILKSVAPKLITLSAIQLPTYHTDCRAKESYKMDQLKQWCKNKATKNKKKNESKSKKRKDIVGMIITHPKVTGGVIINYCTNVFFPFIGYFLMASSSFFFILLFKCLFVTKVLMRSNFKH